MTTTIRFYEAKEQPYGAFCNYFISPITINGKRYQSVEHYFQSQKFHGVDEKFEEVVRTAATPHQAKILARMQTAGGYKWRTTLNAVILQYQRKGTRLRSDWESVKESVMLDGLRAKFSQHSRLEKLLLSTGDSSIVEASPRDSFWGCGADGKGQNKLGLLLMQVRSARRSSVNDATGAAASASYTVSK